MSTFYDAGSAALIETPDCRSNTAFTEGNTILAEVVSREKTGPKQL
jgi:hypothetical protein